MTAEQLQDLLNNAALDPGARDLCKRVLREKAGSVSAAPTEKPESTETRQSAAPAEKPEIIETRQSAAPPYQPPSTLPPNALAQKVIVTDINMPFGSMVTFMVKWALAAIPALIILAILGGAVFFFFIYLPSLGH
jgi:hypothetical protein